jgi:hypothetical protein
MKEKSKHNPFVGMLDADEEILWITHRPTITVLRHFLQTLWQMRQYIDGCAMLTIMLVYVSPCLVVLRIGFPSVFATVMKYAFLGCVGLFMMYPVWYLLVGLKRREKRHTYYAFTNRRILTYRPATGITSDSLEHVHDIYAANSHTLIFEASDPASHVWTPVRDARKIAALMEHAREMYLDDVYLYGDVPHEREEQDQPLQKHAGR